MKSEQGKSGADEACRQRGEQETLRTECERAQAAIRGFAGRHEDLMSYLKKFCAALGIDPENQYYAGEKGFRYDRAFADLELKIEEIRQAGESLRENLARAQ